LPAIEEKPDVARIERARRAMLRGAEALIELGAPLDEVAVASALVACELMRRDIGPRQTVEWLRNTADLQERQIFDGAARDTSDRAPIHNL
jgi:hypothetical protein